ncbi:S-layer domain protein [Thermoclostridium stercorarium subsp. stercorarium DSM 8532]|uniref:S-layer domain protein n=1 Tax=Thermoclostridium stercorarium (strain ATCC 35414 / DSM 8532 / NCIMB 11754) TaxID=1121335 RepID=L7VKE0_THES1|nr:S-layer homology domain-containing protein [Thermoclostridium stercorarium]AGC68600.1 S-layer domain protein [Thermoclostridium stercorarium subsp. stercorarium DSM 8532]AGI39611.1 SLH domain-containing protein [Thermoclostridium stercorarium subsp. stercorarium DSM 8532]
MKTFAKKIARLIIISLVLSVLPMPENHSGIGFPEIMAPAFANAEETISFSDVPKSAWYYDDLLFIMKDNRKIFEGYPDGTFRPHEPLTVDMFIKLIITIMGYNLQNGEEYWATTYIKKAIDEGLIIPWQDSHLTFVTKDDPYAGYKRPISRGDMALIAGRAMDKIIKNPDYRDQVAVASLIKDYNLIPPDIKSSVVKFYDLGILTGYPDGEFKPNNYLTRDEALAVIRRIIDPSARKRPELPVAANPTPTPIPVSKLNRPPKRDLGNGVVEVEGIKFDPKTDIVNKSNGAMGILKAEEFVDVFLKYLKFYEHEGKARVRGYIPELPDGYKWVIGIYYYIEGTDDRGLSPGTISTHKDAAPEKKLPEPGKSFDVPLYTSKDRIESIALVFEIHTVDKATGGRIFISLTLNRYSRYDSEGGHSLVTEFDPRGFFEW